MKFCFSLSALLSSMFFIHSPLARAAPVVSERPTYLMADEIFENLFFGSEMTVSSDELLATYPKDGNNVVVTTPFSESLLRKMGERLIEKYQKQGKVPPALRFKDFHSKWQRPALEITYSNGFSMTIFPDPGVLEMNTPPRSFRDIEKNQGRIQEDYLDLATEFGLRPALFTGSGHIHIDTRRIHPRTLRNFIVDFFNHTSLAAGALNEDIFNSIGVGELPEMNKHLLKKYIKVFDYQESAHVSYLLDAIETAYNVQYSDESSEYQKFRKSKRAKKYHALSLASYYTLGTIELRALRPQANAASYLKLLKLFALKMKVAEERRVQKIYVPLKELNSLRGKPQEVIADFDNYLADVGLHLEDYKEFLMPWWQTPGGEYDIYRLKKESAHRASLRGHSCTKPTGFSRLH